MTHGVCDRAGTTYLRPNFILAGTAQQIDRASERGVSRRSWMLGAGAQGGVEGFGAQREISHRADPLRKLFEGVSKREDGNKEMMKEEEHGLGR